MKKEYISPLALLYEMSYNNIICVSGNIIDIPIVDPADEFDAPQKRSAIWSDESF